MKTIKKYTLSCVRESSYPYDGERMYKKSDAERFFRSILDDSAFESVAVLALNNSSRIIGVQMFEGTTNQAAIYPDQVFRFLLLSGATGFILVHNHPGGSDAPSNADWEITKRLQEGAKIFNMTFQDHLILPAGGDTVSLRESFKWGA
jgi:DNA repair protein RadC